MVMGRFPRGGAALGNQFGRWAVVRPRNWVGEVNRPMDEAALKAVRQSAGHAVPLGTDGWKAGIAARLGLGITLRSRGRPRKQRDEAEESA